MNKKYLVIGISLIALLTIGFVSAYGGLYQGVGTQKYGMMNTKHHEDMESILETGTYQDLLDYREETGYPVMRIIQTEDDFELMKEHHTWMEENGYEPGQFRGTGEGPFAGQRRGMHSGQGFRGQGSGFGGCPMFD